MLFIIAFMFASLTKYETSQLKERKFSFGTQLQSTIHPFKEGKTQLSGGASPWLSLVHSLAVDQEAGGEG